MRRDVEHLGIRRRPGVTRLAWLLRALPVVLVGRIRGDRVMPLPKPPRVYDPKGVRPSQGAGPVHPRLPHRSAWLVHDGELPIVEGTLDSLKVEYLPKEREVPPVWLWS